MEREITLADWLEHGEKLFGPDKKKWKWKCPSCGHIQSIEDFLELKKNELLSEDCDIGNIVYFSCIGRFDSREKFAEMFGGKSPCNYTLGGLICLAETYVVLDDGRKTPVFEFADPEGG